MMMSQASWLAGDLETCCKYFICYRFLQCNGCQDFSRTSHTSLPTIKSYSFCSGDATAEPNTLAYEKSMTLEQQRELEAQKHKELQRKYVFRKKTNDEVAEALEVVDH